VSDQDFDDEDGPTVYSIGSYAADRADRDAPAALAIVDRAEAREGITPFVASTSREDRHTSVLDQSSWRLGNYRKNPVVLWMHGRWDAPIGRSVSSKIADKDKDTARLLLDVEWDRESPQGALIGGQYDRQFLSSGSVGFRALKAPQDRSKLPADHPAFRAPKEGDSPWWPALYYSGMELLEFSAVTVPSNPDAQALRAHAAQAEDPAEQIRRVVREVLERSGAELVLNAFKGSATYRALLLEICFGTASRGATPAQPSTTDNTYWRR